MSDDTNYVPPKVWQWNKDAKQAFNTNRPTAGATHDGIPFSCIRWRRRTV